MTSYDPHGLPLVVPGWLFHQAALRPVLNFTHDSACCRKCLFQIWKKTSKNPEMNRQRFASTVAVARPRCPRLAFCEGRLHRLYRPMPDPLGQKSSGGDSSPSAWRRDRPRLQPGRTGTVEKFEAWRRSRNEARGNTVLMFSILTTSDRFVKATNPDQYCTAGNVRPISANSVAEQQRCRNLHGLSVLRLAEKWVAPSRSAVVESLCSSSSET